MTKEGLLALLERTIDAVKADDSFEGRIEYAWGTERDMYVVNAAVRVGNSMGQGGMILVQEKQAMTDEEQLAAYAEEIDIRPNYLTLNMLIEAHRNLRAFRKEFSGELQAERAKAYKQIMDDHKARKVIAIDELRDMTMQEVIGLLTINLADG